MIPQPGTTTTPTRLNLLLNRTIPAWVAIVSAISILVPARFLVPCSEVSENPWTIGLTLVRTAGRHFGTDFMFTYGPLGVLGSRIQLPSEYLPVLAMDIFLLTHLICIFVALFDTRISLASTATVLLALCATSGQLLAEEQSMTLIVLNLFSVALFLKTRHRGQLFLAGMSSILALFTKVSAGFVTCGLFVAVLIIDAVTTRNFLRGFARGCLYGGGVLFGSWLLNVDLWPYLVAALPIITGYDEAMMRPLPSAGLLPIIIGAYLFAYVLTIITISVTPGQKRKLLPYLALSLIFSFVLFKQSFTRADSWHMRALFQFAPLSLGIFLIPLQPTRRGRLGIPVAGLAITSILMSPLWPPAKRYSAAMNLPPIFGYLSSITEYPKASECVFLPATPLSEEILATIGSSSVDSIPHDVAPLFNAKMRYHSRPILMGYSTYDKFLDGLNANFFRSSPAAPEFILLSPEAIDSRHPFADELQMKLAILEWYNVVHLESTTQPLLLKRRLTPRRVELKEIESAHFSLTDTVEVPRSSKPIVAQVEFDYTTSGRVVGTLLQYPIVYIQLETQSRPAPIPQLKMIKRTLSDGFILSPFIHDSAGANQFFSSNPILSEAVTRFRLSVTDPTAVKTTATVRFFEVITHETS